ncbi:serine protease inhibitor 3/4-like isoform X2 [Zophobas morio]|uniref:serine protease inhibitor 3/4-like isoform X2 n=1 Tax=Zophobas morio TaxID=2755281 RepID=UPI003082BCD6
MNTILFLLSLALFANGADVNDLVDGNVKLSSALYTNLATQYGLSSPFHVGPATVESVLAATQSGAKGATAEEIRTGIFLPNTTADTEAAIKDLLSTINASITNAMFVEPSYTITDEYKTTVTDTYQTSLENQTYIDPAAAMTNLNQWAANHSDNQFVTGFINSDFAKTTKTVLINNFLMDKAWANPFSTDQTISGTFYYYNEDKSSYTQTVSMMTQGPILYNYLESEELDAKFLELPFDDGSTTFTIVVPNAKDGLIELEQQIDKVLATTDFGQEYVQVSLPKESYKVEHTPLVTPLQALGVQSIWSNSADLSGLAGVPGELRVDRVLQSSYINVNEAGAEAIVGLRFG